jgi:Leucine-rich repeat (LRR) protein
VDCIEERKEERSTMLEFERDVDQATINPLYVSREVREGPSAENSTGWGNSSRMVWHFTRFTLFLLIPCIWVWTLPDAYVAKHTLLLTYFQAMYVVVFQSMLVASFLKKTTKIFPRSAILVLAYLLICTVLKSTQSLPSSQDNPAEIQACDTCGDCEYYTRNDVEENFCRGYFPPGSDRVLAIGQAYNGTRLTKESVVIINRMVKGIAPIIRNYGNTHEDVCNGMVTTLLCGALFRPCTPQCKPSKFSTGTCVLELKDAECMHLLNRATAYNQEDFIRKVFSSQLMKDAVQDKLAKTLLLKMAKVVDRALKNFTDGSVFCRTPEMFAANPQPRFNCSASGYHKSAWQGWDAILAIKTIWTLLCCLEFAQLISYRPVFRLGPTKNSAGDITQVICCIFYLTLLIWFIVPKLMQIENEVHLDVGGSVLSTLFGTALIVIAWILFRAMFSLQGKRPRTVDTNSKSVFTRWHIIFEALTDVNDGKFYFLYIVGLEFVEIVLQLATFDEMVRGNDLSYVITSIVIITLNLICTPLGLALYRFDESKGRKVTFIGDTFLESAYLFLNLGATTRENLNNVPIVLSMLIPLACLLSKTDTIIEYSTTFIINKHRRDSLVKKALSSSLSLPSFGSGKSKIALQRKRKRGFATEKWKTRTAILASVTMVVTGVTFSLYMFSSIVYISNVCEDIIGKEIWTGAYPRYVFLDGPFAEPKCHFDTIEHVSAPSTGITAISGSIQLLKNLKSLELANNAIHTMPSTITRLGRLTSVDLEENPVWLNLHWTKNGFETFPLILRHFTALQTLDLGNNMIRAVPAVISQLANLESIILRNNSIHRNGLHVAITALSKLQVLDIGHNEASEALTWRSVVQTIDPKGATNILKLLKHSMKDLDLSHGEFTMEFADAILGVLTQLESFNISHNRLQTLHFRTDLSNLPLRQLDVSHNPVIDVDEKVFYNLDHVWRRGTVLMENLEDTTFFFVFRSAAYRTFPKGIVLQYVNSNQLFTISIFGNSNSSIPLTTCDLNHGAQTLMLEWAPDPGVSCLSRYEKVALLTLHHMVNVTTANLSGMRALRFLNMCCNRNLNVIDLSGSELLERVSIRHNTELQSLGNIRGLSRLKNINHIDLRMNNLYGNFSWRVEGRLTKLTCLNLYGNRLGGNSSWLKKLVSLEYLDMRRNHFWGGIDGISGLSNLKFLGVGQSGFLFNHSHIKSMFPRLVSANGGEYFHANNSYGLTRKCNIQYLSEQ